MVKRSRRARGNVDSVDFSGVESNRVPDGHYIAKIVEAELLEGKDSGEPYRQILWEIVKGKCEGRNVRFDNYSLQPQALFRLKDLLDALGVDVPDGAFDVDWDEIIKDELECVIDVVNAASREDPTKKFPRVVGVAPLTGDDDDDKDEDDEDKKDRESSRSGRKPASKKDEDEEDDSDDDEDEDERADRKSQHKAGLKKLKKGALVRFKDEKNKTVKGTVVKIDGDVVTVEDEDDEAWEVEAEDVTVVG